jgi:hypothetical protein
MRRLLACFLFLALWGATAARAGDEPVDLELIIAVDVSWSVDATEARLQREGYVTAFTDPEVVEAIQSGFFGKIAVLYFEWAGMGHDKVVQDWTLISDEASAKAFAARLSQARYETGYRTSISEAIDFATPRFVGNGYEGRRKVIDISGDGANNYGRLVTLARDDAVNQGITINGLPILSDVSGEFDRAWTPDLDLYYEHCVIGGRGAFVVAANGFQDFAGAIRQKLVLEIADRVPAKRPPPTVRQASVSPLVFVQGQAPSGESGDGRPIPPCDIGERRWMYQYRTGPYLP